LGGQRSIYSVHCQLDRIGSESEHQPRQTVIE